MSETETMTKISRSGSYVIIIADLPASIPLDATTEYAIRVGVEQMMSAISMGVGAEPDGIGRFGDGD